MNPFQTELRAFHGDPAIKAKYTARLQMHHAHDQIIKGTYGDGELEAGTFRGCAVGCTLHSDDHAAYETELGIPRLFARLEDGIFEGLPASDAPQFAVDFLEAIPVGADLSLVWPRFAVWLLTDPKHGVIRLADERRRAASRAVAALYERTIGGETVTRGEWTDAAGAAYAAYASYAAAGAAYAARAAAGAAYAAARQEQAWKLLELLRAAPVEVTA